MGSFWPGLTLNLVQPRASKVVWKETEKDVQREIQQSQDNQNTSSADIMIFFLSDTLEELGETSIDCLAYVA